MEQWARRLGALGEVTRFDYPYMAAGKKRPDRHPVLLEAHRQALAPLGSAVLIGKSMGSRIGCHLALEVEVPAVVCLGYPLVSASGKLRDEVLVAQRQPVLFVQGTRDTLCPLDRLEQVRARMGVPTTLYVVETGDHSLRCTKTWLKQNDRTQEQVDQDAVDAIGRWLSGAGAR